jgi:tripartite-type tricarboxylate transporter receptor subunit TctC
MRHACVVFMATLLCTAQALAQGFPSKPVRMVVPFPPGGSSDVVGRILGERLTEEWHQPMLIDNKAGAGTTIASAFVAGSAPDGYTLYLQGVSTHASAGALYKNIGFDPIKSFTMVGNVTASPFVLVVNSSSPAKTAKDLIDLARTRPEGLSAASSGAGGSPHLYTEMLARATGIKFLHIPYKGMAPAIVALVAGEVNFLVSDVAVMPQVRAGKVRALAVTSPRPSVLVPGVPTMGESGGPNLNLVAYIAVIGPAGMPRDVVATLNAQINRAVANPDARQRLLAQGFEPYSTTPEELGSLLTAETQRLTQVIRESGVKLE